jgi:hypothetical protein
MRKLGRLDRGATQLGFLDVLTALILLAILLWAATMQFSVYNKPAATPHATASPAPGARAIEHTA